MQQTARNNQWRGLVTLKETWIFPTATDRMSWEPMLSAYTHFPFRANGFIFVPWRINLCFQNLLSCSPYSARNKRTPCVCGLFPGYLCINYTGTKKPNYLQVLRGLGESCSMRQDTPELLPGDTQLRGCVADVEKWRHVPRYVHELSVLNSTPCSSAEFHRGSSENSSASYLEWMQSFPLLIDNISDLCMAVLNLLQILPLTFIKPGLHPSDFILRMNSSCLHTACNAGTCLPLHLAS